MPQVVNAAPCSAEMKNYDINIAVTTLQFFLLGMQFPMTLI